MEKKFTKRSTNFTASEETILMQLVKKYAKEIECAETDTNTNKTKNEAWSLIATEFNAQSLENYRDLNVLRNKYNNLKKRSKKKFAEERKCLYSTGGGKAPKFEDTNIDNDIREIISSQMTGFLSEYDDDYIAGIIFLLKFFEIRNYKL